MRLFSLLLFCGTRSACALRLAGPPPAPTWPCKTGCMPQSAICRCASPRLCDGGHAVEQDPNAFQVSLSDPQTPGKTIECTMMETAEVADRLYASMIPRDAPALIASLNTADAVLAEIDEPDEIEALLPAAREVCEALGLDLLDTAVTLTLAGDVAAASEAAEELDIFGDDELDLADDADEDEADAAEVIATFTYEGKTYYIMAVSAPLILVGRQESLTNFVVSTHPALWGPACRHRKMGIRANVPQPRCVTSIGVRALLMEGCLLSASPWSVCRCRLKLKWNRLDPYLSSRCNEPHLRSKKMTKTRTGRRCEWSQRLTLAIYLWSCPACSPRLHSTRAIQATAMALTPANTSILAWLWLVDSLAPTDRNRAAPTSPSLPPFGLGGVHATALVIRARDSSICALVRMQLLRRRSGAT
eukprot:scaffold173538_cov28-Tisochrysis_lutea.AAC.1